MGTTGGGRGHARDGDVDLVRRASTGDGDAFGLLFQRWFDRAFDVAWHVVHNRDTAAEVAQETFAKAWQQISELRQPESFGGWLLRISRNKALNRLQREQRSRPVADDVALEALDAGRAEPSADAADTVLNRDRDALVWVAAAALGDEDASLLSLHLRHGLEAAELAEELGVQPNAAHQRLFRLRKRLGDAVGAWVLWRRGEPSCAVLKTALDDLGQVGFDSTTARAVWKHARTCDDCESARQLRLSPEALFGAIPIVVAGPVLRAKAAAGLEAEGVPVASVESLPPESGPGEDEPPDEPSDEPPGRSSPASRRWLRRTVMGVAAGVALVAALLMSANSTGDGNTETIADELADDSDSTTTTRPTTTEESGSTSASEATAPATGADSRPVDDGDGEADNPPATAPTTPPTETTPPPEPVDPPVIGGFRASRGQMDCADDAQLPVVFSWSSTGGDRATLGPTGGGAADVGTSGMTQLCSAPSQEWTLTVTNAGGGATATAKAPSRPTSD